MINMPLNYFDNRPEDSRIPSKIHQGDIVMIIEKNNQGSKNPKDLVTVKVNRVLSKGDRYENGVKVEGLLHQLDWRYKDFGPISYIGRIQYIIKQIQ